MKTALLASGTEELEKLSALPTKLALQKAVPFLARLARDPPFLDAYILPLLEEARTVEEWYVARTFDAQDGSYSLQVFVWPAETQNPDPRPHLLGGLLLRGRLGA